MVVALAEECAVRQAMLDVRREDIQVNNVRPDRVSIELTIRNLGETRSRLTPISLQSAPLGAFLRWHPLRTLMVPPIDPGGEVRLQTDVDRARVVPLGEFSRVPPQTLIAAIGSDDPEDAQRPASSLALDWRRRLVGRRMTGQAGRAPGTLAPDVFELLGHENPHWAGNINVFIGPRSIERHMARALRIYPGRANMVVFFVGAGPDAYVFEFEGSPLAGYASLVECAGRRSLLDGLDGDAGIEEDHWLEVPRTALVMLVIDVPQWCLAGTLAVRIRQRSTGRSAAVEFDLDASAAGPGCFTA